MLTIPVSFFIIILISAFAARVMNHLESRKHKQQMELITRWRKARSEREQWLAEHPYFANPFVHEDYEELWRIEIGAEELLCIRFPMTRRISLDEYKLEKAEYDTN